MHLFRHYSALAVVVVSATIVTVNNVQSQRNQTLLPYEIEAQLPAKSAFNQSQPENLAFSYANPDVIAETDESDEKAIENELEERKLQEQELVNNNTSAFSYMSGHSLIATAHAMDRDPDDGNGIEIYTVVEGDTLSLIATKHDITVNTILWANNIDNVDAISPGDEIFILPIAGLEHIVAHGENIEEIAKVYEADVEKIIAFNELPANGDVEKGMEIIIPGGQKEIPAQESPTLFAEREWVGGGTKTVEKRHNKPNYFPRGYCTWYVAQHKYIPWGGNAGTWIYNAKAMGYKTGSKPKVGSIVVTTESPYYGHVAIVTKVADGKIWVNEMNYVGWNIESKGRQLSIDNRQIKGYIY